MEIKTEQELREKITNLSAGLRRALDIIRWMSGSNDFSDEGQAYEGWLKVQPDIEKIIRLLK